MTDTVLTFCFFAMLALAAIAIVPWEVFAGRRASRLLRWLGIPVLLLAIFYEWRMPPGMNIRVDLLLLLPAYLAVIGTSAVRAFLARRR